MPEIVNKYFDRAGIKASPVRQHVFAKVKHRYLELAKYSKFDKVLSDLESIKNLYLNFLKIPELRERMVKLQAMKHRASILPSETDMMILGEAKTLSEQGHRVHFITDDGDFISFKAEIQARLNISVVELLELGTFTLTLN